MCDCVTVSLKAKLVWVCVIVSVSVSFYFVGLQVELMWLWAAYTSIYVRLDVSSPESFIIHDESDENGPLDIQCNHVQLQVI